jgi:hypothetical protein
MVSCSVQTIMLQLREFLKFALKIVLIFHVVINSWQHYIFILPKNGFCMSIYTKEDAKIRYLQEQGLDGI